MTRRRPVFGSIERLPSGMYRARYRGPDGRRYTAPTTFRAKVDARAWLALSHADIIKKIWTPPEAAAAPAPKLTLAAYTSSWILHRDLKSRTREHYGRLLEKHILPTLGNLPIASITADDIRRWHAGMGASTPTLRAHCYGLLRTVMGTALSDGRITANPCVIRGAGSSRRVHKIRPASLDEIATITAAMPEGYRAMVLLAAWCALRFGELAELRRRDLHLDLKAEPPRGVVHVERAVVRVEKRVEVGDPKSEAGVRDVAIPPHLLPALQDHLDKFVPDDPDDLLFPAAHGGHLAPATLYRWFYAARAAAGRNDLRWHDLRHSGAVLAAATGATLAELMARLGHSTPAAAMRYQHAAAGRDQQIAELLSALAKPVGAPTDNE